VSLEGVLKGTEIKRSKKLLLSITVARGSWLKAHQLHIHL